MEEGSNIVLNLDFSATEKQKSFTLKKHGDSKQIGTTKFEKKTFLRSLRRTSGMKNNNTTPRNDIASEQDKYSDMSEETGKDSLTVGSGVNKHKSKKDLQHFSRNFAPIQRNKGRFPNLKMDHQGNSFHHKNVTPVNEVLFSSDDFSDLPLHQFTVSNISQNMNITKMTMIQKKAIPALLSGADCIIRSQTGSGKTLAYSLPIIEKLQEIRPKIPRKSGVHALIIVPTRELAIQTYEVLVKLVKPFTWLVPGCIIGGEKRKSEKARLRKGLTILVGTPGRLLDHAKHTRALRFDRTVWLVIDEADRLFEMGYEQDITELLSLVDEHRHEYEICYGQGAESHTRQSILLSATLTPAVKNLSSLALKDPFYIETNDDTESEEANDTCIILPSTLLQFYILTPAKLRLVSLAAFIVWKCQFSNEQKIIVFCGTQDMVDFHAELFSTVLCDAPIVMADENTFSESIIDNTEHRKKKKMQISVENDFGLIKAEIFKLHGNMSSKDRTDVFKTFKTAPSGVMFCTDVASRGLDLSLIDWVIQLTPPLSVAHYGHRVGRTARVGASGSALLFLTEAEEGFLSKLEEARISLQSQDMYSCLEYLKMAADMSPAWQKQVKSDDRSPGVFAMEVQRHIENAVSHNNKLKSLACRAFQSWMRFYSSYPKEMRTIFNMKNAHPGHYASSFGLDLPPSAIIRYSRGQMPEKSNQSTTPFKKRKLPTSVFAISEYSNGLPPSKKGKTQRK